MQMQLIRDIAQDHGIKAGKLNKVSLVRKIQQVEGNFECFATAIKGDCDQTGCVWRDDCFTAAKKASSS